MTSNASEAFYPQIGYDKMLSGYQNTLSGMIGPTKVMISGDTLQVNDYDRYGWTMFDPEAKKAHHDEFFPDEKRKLLRLG